METFPWAWKRRATAFDRRPVYSPQLASVLFAHRKRDRNLTPDALDSRIVPERGTVDKALHCTLPSLASGN